MKVDVTSHDSLKELVLLSTPSQTHDERNIESLDKCGWRERDVRQLRIFFEDGEEEIDSNQYKTLSTG